MRLHHRARRRTLPARARRRTLPAAAAVLLLAAACTPADDPGTAVPPAPASAAASAGPTGPAERTGVPARPGTAASTAPRPAAAQPPQPVGQRGGWRPVFADEFTGTGLDPARWADRSGAEQDAGRGNPGNEQLEWNQAANCRVSGGELVMTARREPVTAASGNRYGWTSCLITSTPSFTFRYAYLEERAILPARRGFWPAFWTWQAPGVDRHVETDAYEFYSDNHRRLYATQFSGTGGRCAWRPPFDPSQGWHVYGVAIEPTGTTWYVDGVEWCRTAATSDGPTNIVSNLAVYARIPPEPGTDTEVKRVDWIRAWQRP